MGNIFWPFWAQKMSLKELTNIETFEQIDYTVTQKGPNTNKEVFQRKKKVG